jgi:hypothetical protein
MQHVPHDRGAPNRVPKPGPNALLQRRTEPAAATAGKARLGVITRAAGRSGQSDDGSRFSASVIKNSGKVN